jgi:hypothetical protein
MRRHLQTSRSRQLLSALLLLAVLVGCGTTDPGGDSGGTEPSGGTATPEPSEPSEPSDAPDTSDARVVEIVTASPGNAEVDRRPVELAPDDHVGELVAGLDAGLAVDVRRAAERAAADPEVRRHVRNGGRLMGAVVWLGCETPEQVAVTGEGDQLRVRAVVKSTGDVQCLVPITTVALFTV